MLLDEDRIIREIRRLAEVVGKALQLRSLEAREEADDVLGALHRAIFGMDRDLTLLLAPQSMSVLLAPSQKDAAIALLESEVALLEADRNESGVRARRAQLEAIRSI